MKHKLIRLTALIMAVIMCIPTNITALAAETTATEAQQTTYTAVISPAEHGTIVFTGGDGNSRKFNKNDKVDVTLRPDKGYQVGQFKVTNTDTGKVLAQKNTTDNRFTFNMPEKNVTISASFSEEGSGNDSENASSESGTSEEDGSDGEDSEPRPEEVGQISVNFIFSAYKKKKNKKKKKQKKKKKKKFSIKIILVLDIT